MHDVRASRTKEDYQLVLQGHGQSVLELQTFASEPLQDQREMARPLHLKLMRLFHLFVQEVLTSLAHQSYNRYKMCNEQVSYHS
jgi:hypothetical protein